LKEEATPEEPGLRERMEAEFFGPPEGPGVPRQRVLRPHPLATVSLFLRSLLTIGAILLPLLVFGAYDADQTPDTWVFTAYARLQVGAGLLLSFAPALRLLLTRYVIDETGIRVRTALLAKTETRVVWDKITAIRHHRGLFDALFGLQRLDVVAYGARGTTVHLVGLRDAAKLRRLVSRRMRRGATLASLVRLD